MNGPPRLAIGLEVHLRLHTETKLFCPCPNRYGAPPNTLVCPICAGEPGALPRPNARALELAADLALVLAAEVAPVQSFDRKHYFYPDLPKGYQITQRERPFARGGRLALPDGTSVPLAGLHLEEDAGKLRHAGGRTLVDLNRAGQPLLEIVTEPALGGPAAARAFLEELRAVARWFGVSDAEMQKGSLRCDVNLSAELPDGRRSPRIEIKNLNSFQRVEQALRAECARLSRGEVPPAPETRRFDEAEGTTRLLRAKESAPDYRFLPEPDIPPFRLAPGWLEERRAALPEGPAARARRLAATFGLAPALAGRLCRERATAEHFERAAALGGPAQRIAHWLLGPLRALAHRRGRPPAEPGVEPAALAELARAVAAGRLTETAARARLEALVEGRSPALEDAAPLRARAELAALLDEACRRRPQALADWRAGKDAAGHALVGEVMRASRGRADARLLWALLEARRRRPG